MNKFIRIQIILLLLVILFSLCACSKLKLTEEMKQSVEIYNDSIKKTIGRSSGEIVVETELKDNAVEFKDSVSVIDFKYSINDGKVSFDRVDYSDNNESAKYKCDGTTVMIYNYEAGTWEDNTDKNKEFLSASTNPFVTLSLFRIDNEYNIDTKYLKDIKRYEKDGYTVIEFVMDNKAMNDIYKYTKADGIVRESNSNIRSYFVDSEGYVKKIIVFSDQSLINNGKEGSYISTMTVTLN